MMSIRDPRIWASLLLIASTARAQEQVYNEDWLASGEVPPAIRSAAEKAVPGVRFESTYRERDLGYRFVGTKADKKTVSVRLAEDGRLISTRTWTPTTVAKVPRVATNALQAEVQDNLQVAGFRTMKATSVELYRADKDRTVAFFELFGVRGDQTPARAEVTTEGVVRRAEIILKHPIDEERRQVIAPASIPPAVRQKVLAASPGSKFTKGVYRVERGGRTVLTAIGVDKAGRAVEVLVEVARDPKAEVPTQVLSVATQIPPDEVPLGAQAKLREGLAKVDDLKEFRATATQRVATPWNATEPHFYLVSGRNAKGKPMQVKIGENSSVQSWPDPDADASPGAPPRDRKFAVLIARYGVEDRWVDVTEAVKAKVAVGRLEWRPDGLPDPAPGKLLVVAYSADNQVGLGVTRGDEPTSLPPMGELAEVPPKGFAILAGWYGAGDRWGDPAGALKARLSGESLEVADPSHDLPDPAEGTHKTLAVAYAIDGEVGLRIARDDRPLALPEGRPTTGAPAELWKVEVPQPTSPSAVGFSPDGKLIFLGGEDGVVRWLDASNGRELGRLEDAGEGRVDALAISPLGAILVARAGRPVRLWPTKDSKQTTAFVDCKEPITVLAFSPKGDQAATGSWDKSARLWDVKTGKLIRPFLGNNAVVMGVGFTADARQLVTTSWDGTARTWDASTGAQKLKYEGDNGQLLRVLVTRDGKLALFVSDRGSLITWDLATGKVVTRVVAPACAGWALALSPDGRRMADAEENAAVLRDVATLKVVARLERHAGTVKVLAFSPDGRTLVTSGDDKAVRLWKLPEGGR